METKPISSPTTMNANNTKPRRSRAGFLLVGAVLLAAGGVAARAAILQNHEATSADEIRGVRLGMSARDVRARFVPGVPGGQWRGINDPEPVLLWSADESAGKAPRARFEFHNGVLVAARLVMLRTEADAKGERLVVSTGSVLSRRDLDPEQTEVTLLARDCPTHAEEVQRLLVSR